MNKLYLLIFLLITGTSVFAQQVVQTRTTLDETSVVRDSTGFQYPHAVWKKLMQSGNYGIKTGKRTTSNIEFTIYELSAAERAKRMESYPRPRELPTLRPAVNFQTSDLLI